MAVLQKIRCWLRKVFKLSVPEGYSSKFNLGCPIDPKRRNIYHMGSPDPWGKGYMAAGGTETKLMVDDEWLGTVQGFTFDGTRGEGSITFIRFDKKAEEKMKSLFSQTKRLTLRAFDGYPTEAFNLLDAEVVFAPGESFGVSTDDLIIDTTLGFSVKERYDVPKPNKEG